jgi:hypothetical protein
MRRDEDLGSLRERDDFKKLVRRARARAKRKANPGENPGEKPD